MLTQAEIIFIAAKGFEGKTPINSATLHHIIGTMGIAEYHTHKYLEDKIHKAINELPGVEEDAGCYAFWSFPDGSKLCILCTGNDPRFVLYEPKKSVRYLGV